MKPTYEVWLEIVKGQLAAGDSAVMAVAKANVVTNAYIQRFEPHPGYTQGTPNVPLEGPSSLATAQAAEAWYKKQIANIEQLKKEQDREKNVAVGSSAEHSPLIIPNPQS